MHIAFECLQLSSICGRHQDFEGAHCLVPGVDPLGSICVLHVGIELVPRNAHKLQVCLGAHVNLLYVLFTLVSRRD